MKYKRFLVLISLAIIFIAGAGYLGTRSGQVEADDEPPPPVTVPVTRGDVQQTVTAPGQVIGTREVMLSSRVAGQLTEIPVQPGQVVRAGQVLAQLDTEPLNEALAQARQELAEATAQHDRDLAQARLDLQIAEARLNQEKAKRPTLAAAEASLTAAQADLDELMAGPDDDEITVAAAELRQAEVDLKQAQWAYDQVAYRGDVGAMPEATHLQEATLVYEAKLASYNLAVREPTTAEIANARSKVQQAQAAYDQALAEQGASGQEVAILAAEVEKARLAIADLEAGPAPDLVRAVETAEDNLQAATLVAPFDGVIAEVKVKPGEMVIDEDDLMLLTDVNALEVWATVIEEDLPVVEVSQSVEVFFDAMPEAAVQGRVERLVPERLSDEDRPLYPIYISLTDPPTGTLLPGMTADASIIIAQRSNVLRLPRATVKARADGTAEVNVWANGRTEPRLVQVGLRGDVYVEIVAGLQEGEQVVGE